MLTDYTTELTELFSTMSSIEFIEIDFLSHEEESNGEFKSFVNNKKNIDILKTLLDLPSLSYDDFISEHRCIIISMGTSSTQLWTMRECLPGVLIGSTILKTNPEMIDQIFRYLNTRFPELPIIMTNSISYFVKNTIDLQKSSIDEILSSINTDQTQNKFFTHLFTIIDSHFHKKIIIVSKNKIDKVRYKFEYGWILSHVEKQLEIKNLVFRNIYAVDLGGGGPDIIFFPNKFNQEKVGSHRFILDKQPEYVNLLLSKKFCNKYVYQMVTYISEMIKAHALKNEIRDPRAMIFMTGIAREQHFSDKILHILKSTNP